MSIQNIPEITNFEELTTMFGAGVTPWTEQWKQEGLQEGLQKGIEQGLEQGLREGRAEILRRQLTRRFGPLPPTIQTRLALATLAQLETWADNILDAETLEAVFDPR
ncbi:MAG: DUF4351 domain-containing protein [Thiotrichales bacterium]